MVLTKLFTTINSHNVVKLTRKLIPLDSRSNKENYDLIHSSIPIAKGFTRLTLVIVSFGNIDSIGSNTPKNMQKLKKIKKKSICSTVNSNQV